MTIVGLAIAPPRRCSATHRVAVSPTPTGGGKTKRCHSAAELSAGVALSEDPVEGPRRFSSHLRRDRQDEMSVVGTRPWLARHARGHHSEAGGLVGGVSKGRGWACQDGGRYADAHDTDETPCAAPQS